MQKRALVPVGRGDERRDDRAARNGHARELDVRGRRAQEELNRRVVAKGLFDHALNEGRRTLDLLELGWMLEQREDCVRDQMCRRHVACHE